MQPEIQVAAQWWTDQLRRPPKFDNGDPTANMMVAAMQAFSGDEILLGEQITAFQQALEQVFYLEWCRSTKFLVRVDYHFDRFLEAAAKLSCVDLRNRLPVKTLMWIKPGLVEVSCGYGAEFKTIFEVK